MSWLALVALSAIGLVVLVVSDLQRAVDEQAARAQAQVQRDAERMARELRAELSAPEVLERVPAATRFTLQGGTVQVPAHLATLAPIEPGTVEGLDAVAGERVRRAMRAASVADALAELRPLFDDASVPVSTRAQLRMHAAWRAHREGCATECEAMVSAVIGTALSPALAMAWASAVLLATTVERARFDAAMALATVCLLPATHARAWCDRLAELGVDVASLRAAADDAAGRRLVLRPAEGMAKTLAVANEPVLRADADALVLFAPRMNAGAILSPAQTLSLARELRGDLSGATFMQGAPSHAIVVVPTSPAYFTRRPSHTRAKNSRQGNTWIASSFMGRSPAYTPYAARRRLGCCSRRRWIPRFQLESQRSVALASIAINPSGASMTKSTSAPSCVRQ